jgi:hypothetical protein
MSPNPPEAHFCANCGAPLTPYASTGPFEALFAEGQVYRQAAEQPGKLLVGVRIWIIFGFGALAGIVMIWAGLDHEFGALIFGVFILPISVALIFKTTRNYLRGRKRGQKSQP